VTEVGRKQSRWRSYKKRSWLWHQSISVVWTVYGTKSPWYE